MFSSFAACDRDNGKITAKRVSLLTDLTMNVQTQFVGENISFFLKL
jgi:hypothetical protein